MYVRVFNKSTDVCFYLIMTICVYSNYLKKEPILLNSYYHILRIYCLGLDKRRFLANKIIEKKLFIFQLCWFKLIWININYWTVCELIIVNNDIHSNNIHFKFKRSIQSQCRKFDNLLDVLYPTILFFSGKYDVKLTHFEIQKIFVLLFFDFIHSIMQSVL